MKYRIIKSQRFSDPGTRKTLINQDLQNNVTQQDLHKLINWLRYGSKDPSNFDLVWHSKAVIARLVGVPLARVNKILSDPKKKRVKRAVKTGKRSENFTPS